MGVYDNDALVAEMTESIIGLGHSIFQIHKLSDTDEEHVARLLERYDFPAGATVIDLGCGIGEVARLMSEQRPDLDFVLVNISQSQLDLCPDFRRVCADFQDVPLDEEFDAVMINYALGHGDLDRVFAEAYRLARSGGKVVIYDITATDPAKLEGLLNYRAHSVDDVKCAAKGFDVRAELLTDTTTDDFMNILPPEQYAEVFRDVYPVVYICTKL